MVEVNRLRININWEHLFINNVYTLKQYHQDLEGQGAKRAVHKAVTSRVCLYSPIYPHISSHILFSVKGVEPPGLMKGSGPMGWHGEGLWDLPPCLQDTLGL